MKFSKMCQGTELLSSLWHRQWEKAIKIFLSELPVKDWRRKKLLLIFFYIYIYISVCVCIRITKLNILSRKSQDKSQYWTLYNPFLIWYQFIEACFIVEIRSFRWSFGRTQMAYSFQNVSKKVTYGFRGTVCKPDYI